MDNISIKTVIILLVVLAACAVAMFATSFVMKRKHASKNARTAPFIIGCVMLVACAVGTLSLSTKVNTALAHGLYTFDTPVAKLDEAIANSPIEMSDQFPTDETPTNAIVVMYRFTCPDCESIYKELNARLSGTRYDIYWISSRSPVGVVLRDAYDIQEVPSIIAFDANGKPNVAVAYYADSAGNAIMDTAAIDLAINMLDASNYTPNNTSDATITTTGTVDTSDATTDTTTDDTTTDADTLDTLVTNNAATDTQN